MAAPTVIRVASFNAENLNREGVFFDKRDRTAPYSADHLAAKTGWMATILDAGQIDLVGFQEVFSLEALEMAVSRSRHLSGATVIVPGAERRGNETALPDGRIVALSPLVGLATRFEVVGSRTIVDFPPGLEITIPTGPHDAPGEVLSLPIRRFERPVLEARVRLPGDAIATVLVAHLKSKRGRVLDGENGNDPVVKALATMRSLIVRAAEALALRAIVVEALGRSPDGGRTLPLILLGDLNDDLPAVTTQMIAGEDAPAHFPIEARDAAWSTLLRSVHEVQEQKGFRDVAYTHVYGGHHELLDHILVSRALVPALGGRAGRVLSARVFNDHVRDERLPPRQPVSKIIIGGVAMTPPSLSGGHGVPVAEIELSGTTA